MLIDSISHTSQLHNHLPNKLSNTLLNQSTGSVKRFMASIVCAGVVTFALFAGMQAMVAQDDMRQVKSAPAALINIMMPELDETIRTLIVVPEPPIAKQLPQSKPLVPDDESHNNDFTNPVMTVPPVQISVIQPGLVVEKQPRPMVRVPPQYPNNAATKGIEGYVTLSFSVNAVGEVENVIVVDAQPKGVFEKAAKRALRKWKYQPRIEQGKAVAMSGLAVTLDFTLEQ
ncbi:TonB family protein [Glaciecola siphonariae]|uniref:Protein TonB n=1 Tax=Glaciecola siphonariae TaxID=521012 RepID=A0ABV9LQC3_9ALTE